VLNSVFSIGCTSPKIGFSGCNSTQFLAGFLANSEIPSSDLRLLSSMYTARILLKDFAELLVAVIRPEFA
jgi:hypothetical protein